MHGDFGGDSGGKKNHAVKTYSTKEVAPVYKIICFCNVLINLDHGVLPAATKEIRQDLQLNDTQLGLLGSVVYIGLMCGSFIAGPLFQKVSTKKIVIVALAIIKLGLVIFPLTDEIILLALSRILVGFCQVFLVIYFPVWIDIFGNENKTIWLTFLQLGVPFGIVLGYILTAFFISFDRWRYSFYTQTILFIPCIISFIWFEDKYLTTIELTNDDTHENPLGADFNEQFLLSMSSRSSLIMPVRGLHDILLDEIKEKQVEVNDENEEDDLQNNPSNLTYVESLKLLWTKKVYIYTMLTLSSIFFVVTGIQFWISDYFQTQLGVDKKTVYISFTFVSVTAPVLGVLGGGFLVSKFGGYTGKHALKLCIVFGTAAALFGFPFPFVDNFTLALALLWLVLFFGGALMPPATGIMLSSVPKAIRPLGSSTAQIFQNLLGYLPSPLLYGVVSNIAGSPRYGMGLLMFWSIWGVIGLALAYIHQLNKSNAKNKNNQSTLKEGLLEIDQYYETVDVFGRKRKKPKDIELKRIEFLHIDFAGLLSQGKLFKEEDMQDISKLLGGKNALITQMN